LTQGTIDFLLGQKSLLSHRLEHGGNGKQETFELEIGGIHVVPPIDPRSTTAVAPSPFREQVSPTLKQKVKKIPNLAADNSELKPLRD
jgi:hypothetical protein